MNDIGHISSQGLNQNGIFCLLVKQSPPRSERTLSKLSFMRKIKKWRQRKIMGTYLISQTFASFEFWSKFLNRKREIILHCSYPKTVWENKYQKYRLWVTFILSTYRIFNSCKWYPHLIKLKCDSFVLNSRIKMEKKLVMEITQRFRVSSTQKWIFLLQNEYVAI